VSSSGNGVLAELRLNKGKLLKRTPSFSLLAGWGFQDRLRNAGFRPKFVKDYAQGIQADDLQRDLISESLQLLPQRRYSKRHCRAAARRIPFMTISSKAVSVCNLQHICPYR